MRAGQEIQYRHRPGRLVVLLAILGALLSAAVSAHDVLNEPPRNVAQYPCLTSAGAAVKAPATGDRGYDVQHYELDLRIDPSARNIDGTVRIELQSLDDGLESVLLDFVEDLQIEQLTWNATPVPYTQIGDTLLIELPGSLAAGTAGTIAVTYNGRPPFRIDGSARGMMFRNHYALGSNIPLGPVISTLCEPSLAHTWWPCKDHPHDKATATIALTVPDTLIAVSNGTLVAESTPEPQWRRFEWVELYPIATYLLSVAISDYSFWHEDCAGADQAVPLWFYVYPEDRERAEADLAPTCEMLQFLENLLGPYPFQGEKYAQAEIVTGGAMENQTVTSLGQTLITGDGRWEHIYLHELAHHWFGNSISPATWQDIWLNEGFARYSEALWTEHKYGTAAYDSFMTFYGPQQHPDLFLSEGTILAPDPIICPLVYDKGAWILHLFRDLVGDDTFFRFLHEYATDPDLHLGNAGTADLIDVASRVAGFDTAAFFQPWLETNLVPELVTTHSVSLTRSGPRLKLDIQQMQEPLFHIRLPIQLVADGWEHTESVLVSGRHTTFDVSVPGLDVVANIDPRGRSLFRHGTAPPPLLQLSAPFPNPVLGDAGCDVALELRESADVTCSLYDVRGRQCGRWQLGNLAATTSSLPHHWQWGGSSDTGEPLPAGIYWLEMKTGNARAVRKLTLLR